MTNTEKFRNACEDAVQVFTKLKDEKYNDIKSKLEYCIGSYDYDKNPEGLFEFGKIAHSELTRFKKKNPRKVNKKVLDNLAKYMAN